MVAGDLEQHAQFEKEISDYVNHCYAIEAEQALKDVYVTDHKRKDPKYSTHSEEEDYEFFKYHQNLKVHNEDGKVRNIERRQSHKYKKGSLAQKIFDPLMTAKKLDNGCLFYELSDHEVQMGLREDTLREQFDLIKNLEVCEIESENMDELRVMYLDELAKNYIPTDQWNDVLAAELDVFKEDEKYDYAKDLRDAHQHGLKTNLADKIFDTLPDFVFWDIKTPRASLEQEVESNKYNPARNEGNNDFFTMRIHEDWLLRRKRLTNEREDISMHYRL